MAKRKATQQVWSKGRPLPRQGSTRGRRKSHQEKTRAKGLAPQKAKKLLELTRKAKDRKKGIYPSLPRKTKQVEIQKVSELETPKKPGPQESTWIIGTARTRVAKHFSRNYQEIACELVVTAAKEAGLRLKDLDGLVTSPPSLGSGLSFMWAAQLAQMLGVRGRVLTLVENGGGTALQALRVAQCEILAGRARHLAVLGMDERRYDQSQDILATLKEAVWSQMMLYGPYLGMMGIGAPIPLYALSSQNYMDATGITHEELTDVVLYQRTHALSEPDALFYGKPVTREEILKSPMLSPPLRLHDCSTFVSGGACVILSAEPIGPNPVRIAGYGEAHRGEHFIPAEDPLDRFPSVREAAEEAYRSAGITPRDLSVVEIYDVFSPTHLMILEELGLAERGKAAEEIRKGRFTYGGEVVVNPSGGRIGFGHPAGATPLISVVEISRQLSGKGGKGPFPNSPYGLAQAEHGMLNGCYLIILEAPR